MNADEIRDARFPGLRARYNAVEVHDLLRRVADELDAGRPTGPLITNATLGPSGRGSFGFELVAVDWFLDQLRRREDPAQPAGLNADPWRDLAVVNHFARAGPGDLADLLAAPSWHVFRKPPAQARKQLWQDLEDHSQECAQAWRDFARVPGVRLWWGRAGARRLELRTAERQTIVSLRRSGIRSMVVSASGKAFTLRPVTGSSWPGIAAIVGRSRQDCGWGQYLPAETAYKRKWQPEVTSRKPGYFARRGLRLRELADEAGMPILYTSGRHYGFLADACITFPGQQCLRFPVRGTDRRSAIMTAIDQAGNKVARYRITRTGTFKWNTETVEIAVHPDCALTDELVLALAISAPWLSSYFRVLESGGG